MKLFSVNVTCPYCYNQINPGDCRIVSRVHPGTVLKDPKRRIMSFAALEVELNDAEPLTSPEYLRELASRQCPMCGYLLPYNIEHVPMVNVAIVGDAGSGKSHYIAALLRHIQAGEVQSETQYLHFTCLTPDVLESYRKEYIEPLFEQNQVLPATPTLAGLPLPLIYEINVMQTSNFSPKKINIVFHDVSGDDYVNPESLERYCHFVLHADAIVYLIEPFKLSGLRDHLPSQLISYRGKLMQVDPVTRINYILNMIERRKEKTAVSIPCAVVLSKFDLLQYIPSTQRPDGILKILSSGYRKGINLKHLYLIQEEMLRYTPKWSGNNLLTTRLRFRHAHFFAVSSTGCHPDGKDFYSSVEPLNCPDPLLWILDSLGVIKIE